MQLLLRDRYAAVNDDLNGALSRLSARRAVFAMRRKSAA